MGEHKEPEGAITRFPGYVPTMQTQGHAYVGCHRSDGEQVERWFTQEFRIEEVQRGEGYARAHDWQPPAAARVRVVSYDIGCQCVSRAGCLRSRLNSKQLRRRIHATVSNSAPRRSRSASVEEVPEGLVDWTPSLPDERAELDEITRTLTSSLSLSASETEVYEHQIEEEEASGTKRKRYVSSDDPMALWRDEKDDYLDQLMRRDGLGDYLQKPKCGCCDAVYSDEMASKTSPPELTTRFFRCDQCEQFLQCGTCLRERHAHLPLHVVKIKSTELTDKNANQGDVLARKLLIAVAERDKQDAEFLEVDKSLSSTLRQEWQARVDDWLVDDSKPNPYLMVGGRMYVLAGPSEAKVAAELKEAEVAEARAQRGEFVDGKMTSAAFVKGLLQLEDLSAGQIDELRASFYKKLNAIHQQQAVYMAGVALLRDEDEGARNGPRNDGRRRAARAIAAEGGGDKAMVPLGLGRQAAVGFSSRSFRRRGKVAPAQCGDALVKIRNLLYAKTHLIYQRNANATGQYASTRSSTLIGRVTDKIEREWRKYQQAYQALVRLKAESSRRSSNLL
ncbi:hypothetical protein HMN09_01384300 [Mycena chlorophos]|uniref:Uncharacterized protein n=1 Tax=Mycena chlorophos TaxID=658473 RepID=A0A8H6RX76_MYCCL|nr:hypothetical protein HMN09_01384300 [Mycena chlorophos]